MKKAHCYKIEPFNTCKPTERWGHSSSVVNNQLVVFGGYADSTYMNDLWVFNTTNLQWKIVQTLGAIPEPRSNATLNYYKQQNKLILFGGGGQGKQRFSSIYALDWDTKSWEEILPKNNQNIPWERTYHAAEIIRKYLVIFGGQNLGDLNDTWIFDLQQHTWTQVKIPNAQSKPCPRRFHTSVMRNNQFIIITGCHNKYRSLKDIFSMDFTEFLKTNDVQTLKWKQIVIQSGEFIPRWGHTSTYNPINDKVYVFGGRFSNDLKDLMILDINKKKSTKISMSNQDSICPRRRHCANFINGNLVLFGGFNGAYFNDLYSIKTAFQNESQTVFNAPMINFSKLLIQEKQKTTQFLKKHLKIQEQMTVQFEELLKSYSHQQINKIFTSVVLGYIAGPQMSEVNAAQINQILNYQKGKSPLIFNSKDDKIKYIRHHYAQDNVLQEIPKETGLNNSSNGKLKNSKAQSNSELAHGIVKMKNIDFQRFIQEEREKVFEDYKGQVSYIQLNNHRNILIDPKLQYTNEFFRSHLKSGNKKISLANVNKNSYRAFQAVMTFMRYFILVIPDNFTCQEWELLIQIGDYFCIQHISQLVETYFLSNLSNKMMPDLRQTACKWRMTKLIRYFSNQLIAEEQTKMVRYYLKNNNKISPQCLIHMEKKLMQSCEAKSSSQKFKNQVKHQFQSNKLSILLKSINEVKEITKEKTKSIDSQVYEKENEENTLRY